jgi:hypothetical protein
MTIYPMLDNFCAEYQPLAGFSADTRLEGCFESALLAHQRKLATAYGQVFLNSGVKVNIVG